MPTIPFSVTVPIGGTVANALAGNQFEFLARPSRVQLYITQDPGDLGNVEMFFGQEIEATDAPIRTATAAGEGPIVPDDLLVDDIGAPGDRLVVRLTETGAAAVAIVRGIVKITPAA